MDCLSVFNPLRLFILYLSNHLFFLSLLFPLMLSFSFLLCLPFQIWLYERLWLLHPPTIPLSQYLPKYYCDHRPKHAEVSLDEFTEFMGHLNTLDVQWVMEWWCITVTVNRVFKDNCGPLVGLRHCSYYSPHCIVRQFGDHQGLSNDDGIFHISIFIKRILDRICETWLKRMVAKDIRFPQFLHPTWGYKAWLIANMRAVKREEKDYQKSNKRKRVDWLPWYAPNFTFLHFMILMSFLFEF